MEGGPDSVKKSVMTAQFSKIEHFLKKNVEGGSNSKNMMANQIKILIFLKIEKGWNKLESSFCRCKLQLYKGYSNL